jgi:hypothetical protein
MKSINEDITRIKKLMNLIEGEQLSLDFEDDTTDDTNIESNITIDSSEFTKPFKEKVFFILKDIYGNTNWSDQEGRGTRGRGGFVNIYTVFDLMKEKGLDDYEQEGGDWSIINYFDTNPQVRKYLVNLWEKETSNSLTNEDSVKDFILWMSRNRNKIFKEGPILKDLVELNATSLMRGEMNERKAHEFLSKVVEKLPDWELSKRYLPGSTSDRSGIDIIMTNEKKEKSAKFQVKPLTSVQETKDGYLVTTYNVIGLDKKPVDYFVFASYDVDDVYVFKNIEGRYEILSKTEVLFKDKPIEL